MSNRHVIGRLTVEVPARQVSDGQLRQQEIGSWLRSDGLWRAISQTLDQLVPDDFVLTIPRLELTIEATSETLFQTQFRQLLQKAVERILQQRDQQMASVMLVHEHTEQLVWHFLETGALPWHSVTDRATAVAAFLNELADAEHSGFVQALQQKIRDKPEIWLRLVYAIGIEKARRLVLNYGRFAVEEVTWLNEMAALLEQTQHSAILIHFWRITLVHHPLAQTDGVLFRQSIHQKIAFATATDDKMDAVARLAAPSSDSDESSHERPQLDTFFVQNAGLVLLGQFLPTLFTRLDLLDDGEFRNEEARFKAIHILQYLVTGDLETYEYELTLNKILCHLPLHRPVPRWVDLTETDLAEADQLLHEAIRHWSVLRNTSIAGLRETFLQRPGKLSGLETDTWQLKVERKTVDILLDRLPMGWGYSVIRLPWMPKLLFVEW